MTCSLPGQEQDDEHVRIPGGALNHPCPPVTNDNPPLRHAFVQALPPGPSLEARRNCEAEAVLLPQRSPVVGAGSAKRTRDGSATPTAPSPALGSNGCDAMSQGARCVGVNEGVAWETLSSLRERLKNETTECGQPKMVRIKGVLSIPRNLKSKDASLVADITDGTGTETVLLPRTVLERVIRTPL